MRRRSWDTGMLGCLNAPCRCCSSSRVLIKGHMRHWHALSKQGVAGAAGWQLWHDMRRQSEARKFSVFLLRIPLGNSRKFCIWLQARSRVALPLVLALCLRGCVSWFMPLCTQHHCAACVHLCVPSVRVCVCVSGWVSARLLHKWFIAIPATVSFRFRLPLCNNWQHLLAHTHTHQTHSITHTLTFTAHATHTHIVHPLAARQWLADTESVALFAIINNYNCFPFASLPFPSSPACLTSSLRQAVACRVLHATCCMLRAVWPTCALINLINI